MQDEDARSAEWLEITEKHSTNAEELIKPLSTKVSGIGNWKFVKTNKVKWDAAATSRMKLTRKATKSKSSFNESSSLILVKKECGTACFRGTRVRTARTKK